MRLIVARCAVDYTGRLTAHLPEALRLVVLKADGSVLVLLNCRGQSVTASSRVRSRSVSSRTSSAYR